MFKLHGLLVSADRKNVETAGGVESLWGLFLLSIEVMAGGIPDFTLLEGIYTSGGIPLPCSPHGLDFYENDGLSVASHNVQLSSAVGVVPVQNFVAVPHQERRSLRLDSITFLAIDGLHRIAIHTFTSHSYPLIHLHPQEPYLRNGEIFVFAFVDIFQIELEFCGLDGLDSGVLHTLDIFQLDFLLISVCSFYRKSFRLFEDAEPVTKKVIYRFLVSNGNSQVSDQGILLEIKAQNGILRFQGNLVQPCRFF